MATFLGIDAGTQGLKIVLLDPERGIVAKASQPLATIPGLPPGYSEQDPDDWVDALNLACAQLSRAATSGELDRVTALGVSGQQHGLVALDVNGAVIRPAILWNDVRCAAECDEIVAAVGGHGAMFVHTGLATLPPGFTAGKIRWLWRHEPEHFERARRFLLPHDHLDLWLTGELAAEAGDASGTGLLDVRRRKYSAELCAATAPGVADRLPQLVVAGTPIGALRADRAALLGLPPGVLVSHGGGDNMMAALGSGAVEPGIVVMSLGTSGTVFTAAEQPVCDPRGEISPFCDSTGGWLPLGCTMNATVATEAARRLFGVSLTDFESKLAAANAGADGVLCVPFLTGERSPDLPAATGALLGLTPGNLRAENVARAAMEGATFALCRLLDRLRALGVAAGELRLTGGGSNSATWCRVVAAAAAVPVRLGVDPDAAALGAAIHAFWTYRRAHGEPDLSAAACRRELALDTALVDVDPDPTHVDIYRERRPAWQAAVDALSPVFHRI